MRFLMLIVLSSFLSGCGCKQINTGYRGLATDWGKVTGDPVDAGLHFYNPISGGMIELAVREQKHEGITKPFTHDTQTTTIHYTVVYAPDATKIDVLFKQLGKDWDTKIVVPTVEDAIQSVIGSVAADDLMGKREIVRQQAFDRIKTTLALRDVTVTQLSFTNIDFEDAYEKAVEAKVVAVQKSAESHNHTVQVEEQAKQQVIAAKAEAESMQIRSEALSKNQALVQYEAVQKWDGKLPQYMTSGGSVPFLQLSGK